MTGNAWPYFVALVALVGVCVGILAISGHIDEPAYCGQHPMMQLCEAE
ncbi:hypothetical protein [Mycolicibacterium palauense]|nr:hypothetical protein [Mycolicibacterium palauense]